MRKFLFLILMLIIASLAACQKETTIDFEDVPRDGDPATGAIIFTQKKEGAPPCDSCHTIDDSPGKGPSLQGYKDVAGKRVEGQSAEKYTFYSILLPSKHVVDGFSNIMYKQYDGKFTAQELGDLIAYLLTL